jgi:uncharacterized protein (DUF1810 family)
MGKRIHKNTGDVHHIQGRIIFVSVFFLYNNVESRLSMTLYKSAHLYFLNWRKKLITMQFKREYRKP